MCAEPHLLCRDCVLGYAITRTAETDTYAPGNIQCVATTLSRVVAVVAMLITAYIIEHSLCMRCCPELDVLYLIYSIYLMANHMRKILSRMGLIKFKSEYDSNYGKSTQKKSSLKERG